MFSLLFAYVVSCVHGIAHQMSKKDFLHLLKTEGNAGHNPAGYIPTLIDIHLYNNTIIQAYTLIVSPSSNRISKTAVLPSTRYVNLLRKGAKTYELDDAYITYLNDLPSFTPVWSNKVIAFFQALFTLTLLFPIYSTGILYYVAISKRDKIRTFLFDILLRSIQFQCSWIYGTVKEPYSTPVFLTAKQTVFSEQQTKEILHKFVNSTKN